MSAHHWIVTKMTDKQGEVTIFEKVDFVPSPGSSRILAEEIEGKSKTSAFNILEKMYETVATHEQSARIFCRGPVALEIETVTVETEEMFVEEEIRS